MHSRTAVVGLLAIALYTAACNDVASPSLHAPRIPAADVAAPTASGIMLDQVNGTLNENGTILIKGFNPTNPHNGDAIVATFFWLGSTNIITSVWDHLTDVNKTPAGNTYTLVEYVTSGGISMATYVATNVQNFPDATTNSGQILAVEADLSAPVTDGGVVITAWSGVNSMTTLALGAHHSAVGSSSAPTTADPGPLAVNAGALAYAVTMGNLANLGRPGPPFIDIGTGSDQSINEDAEYALPTSTGSVDPQWTWYFTSPSSWLATVVALNPALLRLAFKVQPSTTLPLATITPAVQVAAVDPQGNPVASFNGPVTIAIGHNGGLLVPGTLSGTKTVTAVNGIATFSDLSIDQAGNGYTLVVVSAGMTGAESAPFDIGVF
jgi:hypothetical protein